MNGYATRRALRIAKECQCIGCKTAAHAATEVGQEDRPHWIVRIVNRLPDPNTCDVIVFVACTAIVIVAVVLIAASQAGVL